MFDVSKDDLLSIEQVLRYPRWKQTTEKNVLFSIFSVWMKRVVTVPSAECTASAVAALTSGWWPVGPTAWSNGRCTDHTAKASPEVCFG
jgi:hypothetical protein